MRKLVVIGDKIVNLDEINSIEKKKNGVSIQFKNGQDKEVEFRAMKNISNFEEFIEWLLPYSPLMARFELKPRTVN